MPKRPDIEVLTANNLVDGEVVFLTSENSWSKDIDEAAKAVSAEEAEVLMKIGEAAEAKCEVVGLYLVGVLEVAGKLKADHIRERIRTLGPTVRLDLGKQSEGSAGDFPALDK